MRLSLIAPATIVLATAATAAQDPPGACLVNDQDFNTQDGGCKDLNADRVWAYLDRAWYRTMHADAVDYCQDLVEGGFDDWRLPTRDELTTLVANGGATHLDVEVGWWYWTSETQGNLAWAVAMWDGSSILALKRSLLPPLCVRGGNQGGGGLGLGGGGGGGGSGNATGGGDGSAPGIQPPPRIWQLRKLTSPEWTILVNAPKHAGRQYVVLAGPTDAPSTRGLTDGGPLVVVGASDGGTVSDAGRATVRLDLRALGVDSEDPARFRLAIVFLEPSAPNGIGEVVELAERPHAGSSPGLPEARIAPRNE